MKMIFDKSKYDDFGCINPDFIDDSIDFLMKEEEIHVYVKKTVKINYHDYDDW